MIARAACVAAAVLAASAIAHATGGDDAGGGTTTFVAGGAGGPTVVAVGAAPGVATGFTIAPGRVVTVAHALDGAETVVRGPDGAARRATVTRRDDRLDLALLAVPGLPAAPAATGGADHVLVRRRDGVTALPATVLRRIDARVRQAGTAQVARRPALELTAATGPGDSGAPVLQDGRVTGILFARSDRRRGVAYAVDARVLDRLTAP